MKKIDDAIQLALQENHGDARTVLENHAQLDYLYALSDQRRLLLDWYDFDPEAELLQVGADYGAMTGLYTTRVNRVTVLNSEEKSLETVRMRCPMTDRVEYVKDTLTAYAAGQKAAGMSGRFDYVVMTDSTAEALDEEQICAAKELLKPDGILILAVPNALGMKYLAGTAPEAKALTKQKLSALLGGDAGQMRFYYPMPDYRTPITIYSDFYLPKKGDISRVIPAYDYTPYHTIDMGEKLDLACEASVFE